MSCSAPRHRRGAALLLLLGLGLAGCSSGVLPFGARTPAPPVATPLARPPVARIAVPAPPEALLDRAASERLSRALADALLERELPAVPGPGRKGDWRLVVTAEARGDEVVVDYGIEDEAGTPQGATRLTVPARGWAEGEAGALRSAAVEAAPRIVDLITRAERVARTGEPTQPGEVRRGPPVVAFSGVTGAPGDGNQSLTRAIRNALADQGLAVTERQGPGAGRLSGEVAVVPHNAREERVEIIWTILRADGEEIGKVVQLNTVPRGTLAGRWGDVAYVVAQEAAAGVRDVIRRAEGG